MLMELSNESLRVSPLIIVRLKQVVPFGFRKMLVWIKTEYNNPPMLVTENGYSDKTGLHDMERAKYIVVRTGHCTNQ
jgi:beta-glucosidase/6-phospho-beta-glucosidase/beta-galactosidase